MSARTHEHDMQALETTAQSPTGGRIRLEKTIEQLAAEQGVKPMTNWDDYFGAGKDLWESDEDFEEFLRAARRPLPERL
jgi:hypothetical protein